MRRHVPNEKPLKGCLALCSAAFMAMSMAGENFIVNGDFHIPCGWNARQPEGATTPFEGWSWNGTGKALTANGGIALTAPGTLRSDVASAKPVREYVLVFEVKTKDAKGFASFSATGKTLIEAETPAPADAPWSFNEFLEGTRKLLPARYKQDSVNSPRIAMPEDTSGKFQTLSACVEFKKGAELPAEVAVQFTLDLKEGTCEMMNVRIEDAPAASGFHPAKDEWLTIGVAGVAPDALPSFSGAGEKTFQVTNTSGHALSGILTLSIDSWRTPGRGNVLRETRKLKTFAPDAKETFLLEPGKFPPDAYVASATFESEGAPLVAASLKPLRLKEKRMTEGLNMLCFAVYPDIKPAKIFGVGNGMIGRFFTDDDVDKARELELASVQCGGMIGASLGAPKLASETIDDGKLARQSLFKPSPALDAFRNPIRPNSMDIFVPEVRREIAERGAAFGKYRSENPGVYALRINNEKAYFNCNSPCPSTAADKNFREWCQTIHGSLDVLNKRWGTNYKSWEDVEQVISSRKLDLAKSSFQEKRGAEAVNWLASSSFLRGENYEKSLRENWAQTMDWMRWTTASTLWLYSTFIDSARKYDKDTIYGNCFCWPNFWPAVTIPHFRASQAAQLDTQYCAGFDGGVKHDLHLGNNDEMLDGLEMTESIIPGKPILGNEIYIQPSYDAEYPALQNWAFAAHGMSNILIFAWKKFSDHGYKVFFDEKEGKPITRYWERPDAIPCWMLFDVDGTKLPVYDSVAKSSHEIADFHKRYDFWSVKRMPSRVGWYLANDSSELVIPISANRPWDNPIITARVTLASSLRRGGVTMNYLDDADLARMTPENFDVIIVPPAPVLSDKTAKALADFAKAGGRLVVVGPTGVYDPWLKLHPNFGGDAWSEINATWKVPARWGNPDVLIGDMLAYPVPSKGSGLRPLPPEQEVQKAEFAKKQLMSMPEVSLANGDTLGDFAKSVKWGKGEIVVVSTFPERRTQMPFPTPELRAYMNSFVKELGLPCNGYFKLDGTVPADNHKMLLGHGVPEVEVVVREKSPSEHFVFALNCGGSGSGCVILPGNASKVVDVLNGEAPVPFQRKDANIEIPLKFGTWGYHVLRVTND